MSSYMIIWHKHSFYGICYCNQSKYGLWNNILWSIKEAMSRFDFAFCVARSGKTLVSHVHVPVRDQDFIALITKYLQPDHYHIWQHKLAISYQQQRPSQDEVSAAKSCNTNLSKNIWFVNVVSGSPKTWSCIICILICSYVLTIWYLQHSTYPQWWWP